MFLQVLEGKVICDIERGQWAYLVGVLNSDPESTRFQRSSAQITDSESVVVRGFAETPTGLGQWGG
jgi:hypothetical protein